MEDDLAPFAWMADYDERQQWQVKRIGFAIVDYSNVSQQALCDGAEPEEVARRDPATSIAAMAPGPYGGFVAALEEMRGETDDAKLTMMSRAAIVAAYFLAAHSMPELCRIESFMKCLCQEATVILARLIRASAPGWLPDSVVCDRYLQDRQTSEAKATVEGELKAMGIPIKEKEGDA